MLDQSFSSPPEISGGGDFVKKQQFLRPTPTKLGFGGLTITILISLIVVGLELKKSYLIKPQILYLKCSVHGMKMKDAEFETFHLRCSSNDMVQPVIDKTKKQFDVGHYLQLNVTLDVYKSVYKSNVTKFI